ncbi:MAG TPA: hypothetical protein VK530_18545 [Candidatus Acidoferrum sp.]|nr:hypothetical protein [Candidatus Acidoferrum sp.]
MSTPREDADQLRLLSILYYVWGGLTVMLSCLGGVWAAIVLGIVAGATRNQPNPPPAAIGGLVAVILIGAIGLAVVVGALTAWTGKCIGDRRSYTFCLVIAAITCLSFPFGTALGVFTLIVVTRPSVKALFGQQTPATA